ncbi:CHASE2 domain-containing protein [Marinobacter sp. SS21]|uniref:CHASE2 domain-containing protein n=1 Tax=Marinobacter sp. SS21 TaxID=2979460 RepID=UPI00232F42AA|nr:CHASE2 domain-containing protein [Marinobacter sp. SS21]MDC0664217.1 CHASE2 domain-containing protein [Marinobacter sp. SS21]
MNRDRFLTTNAFWTLGLSLLAILVLAQLSGIPQRANLWLYDSLITSVPAPLSEDVAVIAIDEYSLEQLGQWPWPRSTHAELIQRLDAAGVRTIVFDVLFPEPSIGDEELANAMQAHGRVVLPVHLSVPATNQPMTDQLPIPPLQLAATGFGHAHVELDRDGLARGMYLYNGLATRLWPSLAKAAAAPGTPPLGNLDGDAAPYMNVRTDYVAVPLAGRPGTLPTVSYAQVLQAEAPMTQLSGKTVFIGATAVGFGDILPTPFSSLAWPMSGVEFHANAYSALVKDRLIRPAAPGLSLLLTALVLLLIADALPRLRPHETLVLCTGVLALLLALFTTLLLAYRVWLSVTLPLLIPIAAYPLWSAQRLTITNRFLNRQLDELGTGQQFTLPEPADRQPSQLLEHLIALFNPIGWYLSVNGRPLAQQQLQADDSPKLTAPGQWVHKDNQSWIQLKRADRVFELGLAFPASLIRDASQRYLRRLVLDPHQKPDLSDRPREHVSARIERVRQATERLNQMQLFIRKSFERMPDGIIVTDELGVIQFANGHIEEWFGEPRPSLAGTPLTRLLQGHDPRDNPPWQETVSETLTLHQSRTVDLRVREMDFLIHFAPFKLSDDSQNGIIANISNISELRAQQRQHREAIDFISHDVRSPLVSQLALIEQLKRNPSDIQSQQLEQLGRLARRSYQLAEEFVQLARAEQLTETRFYDCELLAIVENARDSVSEQAVEKGIQLVLQGNEDLWLLGNAELLERAIINLLTNAVQYSDTGSAVTIQVFQAGHEAYLRVTDEGNGIAPEEIPFLFDRYRRQRSSELSGSRGTGLGLSFVNVVVQKHRGDISVESVLGEGSSFTIKLPITDPLP